MSKEEIKVCGMNDVEAETVETEGKMDKAKNFIKKHGKKVAAIAGLATMGLIGYALGHKSKSDDADDIVDYDYAEVDDVKIDNE